MIMMMCKRFGITGKILMKKNNYLKKRLSAAFFFVYIQCRNRIAGKYIKYIDEKQ